MTAVKTVAFESRSDRQNRERVVWVAEAVAYLIALGVYAPDELEGANDLADNLWWYARDEGGEMMYSAKEAVDEELTYWGD